MPGLPLMILRGLGGRNLNSWGVILQFVRKDNFVSGWERSCGYCFSATSQETVFIRNTSTLFQIRLDIRVFLSKQYRQKQLYWSACSAYSGPRPGRRHLRRGRTKAKILEPGKEGATESGPAKSGIHTTDLIASTHM